MLNRRTQGGVFIDGKVLNRIPSPCKEKLRKRKGQVTSTGGWHWGKNQSSLFWAAWTKGDEAFNGFFQGARGGDVGHRGSSTRREASNKLLSTTLAVWSIAGLLVF